MKAKEILAAIKVTAYKETIQHVSKLAAIYDLLKAEKNNIVSVTNETDVVFIGRTSETIFKWGGQKPEVRQITEGEKLPAEKITVTTTRGVYCFNVPVNNQFYFEVCDLLGINYNKAKDESEVLSSYLVSADFLNCLNVAKNFVSKDDLRPAMQTICLYFQGSNLQIIATDAHQLYESRNFKISYAGYFKVLVDVETIKKISKTKEEFITVDLLEDSQVRINGVIFTDRSKVITNNYPDYKCVIPEYNQEMKFNRELLKTKVNGLKKFANKRKPTVDLHLNGNISMLSCDIDYGIEGTDEMSYIDKTFSDMDIRFNCDLLANVLKAFKVDDLTMQSEGKSDKAAIFTDGVDKVLLMPISY